MGFMDKAQDLAGKHSAEVEKGIDKAGDEVDERTDDKYTDQVDKGQEMLNHQIGLGNDGPGDAPTGADQVNP